MVSVTESPQAKNASPNQKLGIGGQSFQTKGFQQRVEAQTESSWQEGQAAEDNYGARRSHMHPKEEETETGILHIVFFIFLHFELEFLSCFVLDYIWF